MVFCIHCGKDISLEEINYCPSCGKPQNNVNGVISPTQTKSPGKTLAIALIAGAFIFEGIGHLYIGKTKKGIGILIAGWILIALSFVFIPISIITFVLWIWQAYDAHKQAKHYNEFLANNGRAPW